MSDFLLPTPSLDSIYYITNSCVLSKFLNFWYFQPHFLTKKVLLLKSALLKFGRIYSGFWDKNELHGIR